MKTFTEQGRAPIKAWIDHVPQIEASAMQQLRNVASLPFIHHHLAVMPDVHWGVGATVGSVIATKGAVIPAAVGVDLGCGMLAVELSLTASDLPDSLSDLRSEIEGAVPHGRSDDGGPGDKGAWKDFRPVTVDLAWKRLEPGYEALAKKHQRLKGAQTIRQLGTLGGGNHFIELCLDERQRVWVMLHSGSRGIGNRIGSMFIAAAKEEMMRRGIANLPDKDLAYLSEGSELFHEYWEAVDWAQNFAAQNRYVMMGRILTTVMGQTWCRHITGYTSTAISCHHNYVSRETHYGEDCIVTRKGAVSARLDQFGIIPGSMGAKSFIVRGLGNPESFESCSHGAGRVMSRGAAKKLITLDDHAKATAGVECRKDAGVLDESPAAYKDVDQVMASQSDLVEIVHTLKAVLCVKG